MCESTPKIVQTSMRQRLTNLAESVEGFAPRAGQNMMFAQVAKTIFGAHQSKESDLRSLIIEGQTGSGKTIGYLLPALEAISYFNRDVKDDADRMQLVVATANVSLQQQILKSDLPALLKSGVEAKAQIVVGRSRYICMRDAMNIASNASPETSDGNIHTATAKYANNALQELLERSWTGIRDDLKIDVPDYAWSSFSANAHTCTNSKCEHASDCPFLKDRRESRKADLLITNHALVAADSRLRAQGVPTTILPSPEKTILICDEAHHFPDVFRGSQQESLLLGELVRLSKNESQLKKSLNRIGVGVGVIANDVSQCLIDALPISRQLNEHFARLSIESGKNRFQNGVLGTQLASALREHLLPKLEAAQKLLDGAVGDLSDEQQSEINRGRLQSSYITIVKAMSLLDNSVSSIHKLIDPKNAGVSAKWFDYNSRTQQAALHYCPINVAHEIRDKITGLHHSTIFASATLRCLGKFSRFASQMGFSPNDGSQYLLVESPFNYSKSNLKLYPKIVSPTNEPEHTQALLDAFTVDFENHHAGLMLFSSRRQMDLFVSILPEDIRAIAKVQYESPRNELVDRHIADINRGAKSLLIGVQSFSEGLDLPGKHLTYVGIAKIPFGDHVNDPLMAAESEFLQSSGKHPFASLSLPEASKRLIQSVGRLVRSHNCSGDVAIYDCRLLSKGYGQQLIDGLPMMNRVIQS